MNIRTCYITILSAYVVGFLFFMHSVWINADELMNHINTEYDTSCSSISVRSSSNERTPTKAIVHVGLHKTGTTTIQRLQKKYQHLLYLDGYEMPWHKKKRTIDGNDKIQYKYEFNERQEDFAICFLKTIYKLHNYNSCNPDLLLHGLDILSRKRNIFISSESFAYIDKEGVEMLSSYLSSWDEVTIVVYYRRFHSWIGSISNQITKSRTLTNPSSNYQNIKNLWETSITEFMDLEVIYETLYAIDLVDRLKDKFENNVLVMNYHDESVKSLEESFYCDAMKGANRTCSAIRNDNKEASNKHHYNSGVNLDYSNLAYGAMKAGLIKIETDKRMEKVTAAVQNFQEKTLSLTANDFPRACPSADVLDKIWKLSLLAETRFFPEKVNSTTNDLRSDFEKAATTTLCKIDVESILKQSEWVTFFESLE